VLLDPLLEVVAVALEAVGGPAGPDPVRDDVESLVVFPVVARDAVGYAVDAPLVVLAREDGGLPLLDPEIDVALEAVFRVGKNRPGDHPEAHQQE
jgi:hypothetical protein